MDNTSIAAALREYFLACPLLEKYRVGVDWLPDRGVAFSIDTTPASQILQRYASGSSLRQYLFNLCSVQDYGPDTLQNLANSGLYEELAAWMDAQTKARRLPDLGPGRTPRLIEAQSTGYLFTVSSDSGRYQIQCRLVYFQKGDRR